MGRASIKEVILNPSKIIKHLGGKGYFKWIPDELYLKICYRAAFGKKLDLENPKGFNEKLQWLKLYDRNPIYTTMVDKLTAKEYVANIIGEQYIIPTYGVWDRFEDIDFDSLPEQFVLKCTHDSGGLVICKNKAELDMQAVKRKIEASLKRQFYYVGREWPYKNVKPRIIAEKYLSFLGEDELVEYKIFCFNGEPALFLVCKGEGHTDGRTNDFYDLDFNHIPVSVTCPNAKEKCEKPDEYDELISLVRLLAKDIYHLRVDFYVAKHNILFGEMTFYHDCGYCHFDPPEWDERIGKMLKLPIDKE